MTCRFTFELCRNWKSGCINSQGDGNPVFALSYLTQLHIQKLKFLWSSHPGVFSSKKGIMKIFCITKSIYCSFTTCVLLSWAFGWMKALLQQSWIWIHFEMLVAALPQARQPILMPLSVGSASLSHVMAEVPSHSYKSLQYFGKWQAWDAVLWWFIWVGRCWGLEIH